MMMILITCIDKHGKNRSLDTHICKERDKRALSP